LGEREKGLASLRNSVKERSFYLSVLLPDPVFDAMRSDPEFASALSPVHLALGLTRYPAIEEIGTVLGESMNFCTCDSDFSRRQKFVG
jgi:hypothetical protein